MRKVFTMMIIAGLIIGFAGCESSSTEDPGNIPGMGVSNAALEVEEAFQPDGFLFGDAQGVEYEGVGTSKSYLKSTSLAEKGNIYRYGCGRFVKVKVTITNTRDYDRCCWLPAGLVFEVSHRDYQHGILLCWTPVWLKANSQRTIYLMLFCINRGRSGSDGSVTYKIKGVTNSGIMKKYIRRLLKRKINIEFYRGLINVESKAMLKAASADDMTMYDDITENLQESLWELTDGGAELTQEQIDYIEALPMMPEGAYPAGLGEDGFVPPEDWKEYPIGVSVD